MSVILTGSVKLMRRESVRSNVLQALLVHCATVSIIILSVQELSASNVSNVFRHQ